MPPAKKKKTGQLPKGLQWQYMDGAKWKDYAPEDTAMLEGLYGGLRGSKKVAETKDLSFNKEYGSVYKFDFGKWTQLNKDSKNQRKIRRILDDSDEDEEDDSDEEESDEEDTGGVTWEMQDNVGMWTAFYDPDTLLLEKKYAQSKTKKFDTKDLSFNQGFDTLYTFDFKNMTQKNNDSGNVRPIRRVQGKPKAWAVENYGIQKAKKTAVPSILDVPYPETWTKPTNATIDMVPVGSSTKEYKEVLKDFLKTINKKVTVSSVTRIQNYALWPFYAMQRNKIELQNKGKGGCNEMMLFHGARVKANMDSITRFGFDTRVANAGSCGTGTYFAVNARYSDGGYVYRAPDGTKEMFICRVLVGRYALRTGQDRRPPPLDASKPNEGLYDSVVDNMKCPVMHVVFYDNQAIPQYIVKYK